MYTQKMRELIEELMNYERLDFVLPDEKEVVTIDPTGFLEKADAIQENEILHIYAGGKDIKIPLNFDEINSFMKTSCTNEIEIIYPSGEITKIIGYVNDREE